MPNLVNRLVVKELQQELGTAEGMVLVSFGGLTVKESESLRNALANARQKVVGVVFNAIDDHLSGPDQLHQRWTLEGLRLLPALLREAREARRVLIVTADHGHLLEDGTRLLPGADSDRWRAGDSVQERGELLLRGNRVLTSHGNGAVVCLWSECARFAGRKNGYHGGASLAEVLVPLGVFGATSIDVPGWTAAGPAQPDWWDMAAARPPAVSAAAAYAPTKEASRPSRRSPAKIDGQGTLFEPTLPLAPVLAPRVEQAIHNWIDALLASAVYASQRQLAARVALPEPQMRRLLEALAERGDKLSRAALAQRMAQPEIRMGGLLSAVRRVLNVDRAEVLSVDDASGTVELNRTLLIQQFQLPDGGRSK